MSDLEVVLPRRAIPQPKPAYNKGGDCGGCVLAGLLGISLDMVYDKLTPEAAPFAFSRLVGRCNHFMRRRPRECKKTNAPLRKMREPNLD